MDLMEIFFTALSILFPLIFFSVLYRDNIFFKFGEHTLLGIMVGIEVFSGFKSVLNTGITPALGGNLWMIIAVILGILVYTRFFRQIMYISYIPLSILIGIGIGLSVRGAVVGQILKQVSATILPVIGLPPLDAFNNLLIIIGTISTLTYFTFTKQRTGVLGISAKIGRYFLMISMGVGFANSSLGHLSGTIVPMQIVFTPPGIYATVIAGLIILIDIYLRQQKKNP